MDALEVGACTDEWLQDQLIIFMALAQVWRRGRSCVHALLRGAGRSSSSSSRHLPQEGGHGQQAGPTAAAAGGLIIPWLLPPFAGPVTYADGRAHAAHTHGVHGGRGADWRALFGRAGAGGTRAGTAARPVAGGV